MIDQSESNPEPPAVKIYRTVKICRPGSLLADAIRKGAQLRPQTHAHEFFDYGENGIYASTALGAAYEVLGGDPFRELMLIGVVLTVIDETGFNLLCKARHPLRDEEMGIFRLLENLNNYHRWTREQIADFIECNPSLGRPESVPQHSES